MSVGNLKVGNAYIPLQRKTTFLKSFIFTWSVPLLEVPDFNITHTNETLILIFSINFTVEFTTQLISETSVANGLFKIFLAMYAGGHFQSFEKLIKIAHVCLFI